MFTCTFSELLVSLSISITVLNTLDKKRDGRGIVAIENCFGQTFFFHWKWLSSDLTPFSFSLNVFPFLSSVLPFGVLKKSSFVGISTFFFFFFYAQYVCEETLVDLVNRMAYREYVYSYSNQPSLYAPTHVLSPKVILEAYSKRKKKDSCQHICCCPVAIGLLKTWEFDGLKVSPEVFSQNIFKHNPSCSYPI